MAWTLIGEDQLLPIMVATLNKGNDKLASLPL